MGKVIYLAEYIEKKRQGYKYDFEKETDNYTARDLYKKLYEELKGKVLPYAEKKNLNQKERNEAINIFDSWATELYKHHNSLNVNELEKYKHELENAYEKAHDNEIKVWLEYLINVVNYHIRIHPMRYVKNTGN